MKSFAFARSPLKVLRSFPIALTSAAAATFCCCCGCCGCPLPPPPPPPLPPDGAPEGVKHWQNMDAMWFKVEGAGAA